MVLLPLYMPPLRGTAIAATFDENYENVIIAYLPQLDGFYVALEESVCLSQK